MKWTRYVRRAFAFFCATLVLWWLVITHRTEGAALPPPQTAAQETLNGWEQLIVRQSPFLKQSVVLSGETPSPTPAPSPSAPPSPSPTPVPTLVPEDDTPLPPAEEETRQVIAQTLLPAADGSWPSVGGVFLFNRTSQAVDMTALAQQDVTLTGTGAGPSILIIHTHSTEAYTPSAQNSYEESDSYRTTDNAHNVVRVGDEMAAAYARAGLNVLHDRNLYDYPNYNGAYTRSRQAVEEYLAAFPSISVVLDVHRDAILGDDGAIYKVVADPDTLPGCAQVMLVVGTQEGGGNHPNWRENLALAIRLEQALNDGAPTLARPIVLRKSHYNQHLSPGSLLVEVGTHGNTLSEAIEAARDFAELTAPVIAQLLP